MNKSLLDIQSPTLILASASPRRRELLASLSLPFTVVVPDVTEDDTGLYPPHVPLIHAETKAAAVAAAHPDAVTLGADTTILFRGKAIGKPSSPEHAVAMLLELSGQRHEVVTGVCLLSPARGLRCRFAVTTQVRFRSFDETAARAYVSRVHTLDKAGAYALQEDQGALIAAVEGSPSNVVGLPLETLAAAFQVCGLGWAMTNRSSLTNASSFQQPSADREGMDGDAGMRAKVAQGGAKAWEH
jgi:septum formation protein